MTSRRSASGCVAQAKPHAESPPLNLIWEKSIFGERAYSFTGKSRGVDVNFVDGVAIVIHCKDELHLFSIVGLGAVKQGQSLPQTPGAVSVPPWKLGFGANMALFFCPQSPARVQSCFLFVLFWFADRLTVLSKEFLDSSNFNASDSS